MNGNHKTADEYLVDEIARKTVEVVDCLRTIRILEDAVNERDKIIEALTKEATNEESETETGESHQVQEERPNEVSSRTSEKAA